MDITEYALPTDRGLTRGDGQLVDFLRCVAALAWVGRSSTSNLEIYSRSRADLGPRTRRPPTGTFRRARFKHGAHEFLGPPHAPGGCPVPRAAHGERVKTLIGISIPTP